MSAETIIHTIRHARTAYNAERRYAGTIDIPLSKEGICEARDVAPKLAGLKFDIVFTSMMRRTIETAQILIGQNTPIIQTPLCNERKFGIMEGCTWEEMLTFEPPVMLINVGQDLHTVNPKGGEPFEVVWERARKFHRFLFKKNRGAKILVVSHAVFLQMFNGLLRGLSCIESLSVLPSHLELNTFRFSGNRLVDDKAQMFMGIRQVRF